MTFDELRQRDTLCPTDLENVAVNDPEVLSERFLRKASAVALYTTAKRRGDASEKHFKNLQDALNTNAGASLEDRVVGLSHAMQELSKGLLEQRHQIGAVAALATAALMINEKKRRL